MEKAVIGDNSIAGLHIMKQTVAVFLGRRFLRMGDVADHQKHQHH